MLFKLILFVGLAYLGYRLFVGPPLLSEDKSGRRIDQEKDEDDFTDYEEID